MDLMSLFRPYQVPTDETDMTGYNVFLPYQPARPSASAVPVHQPALQQQIQPQAPQVKQHDHLVWGHEPGQSEELWTNAGISKPGYIPQADLAQYQGQIANHNNFIQQQMLNRPPGAKGLK